MAVDVSCRDFNAALWKRFKEGKIRNVYPLAKYNDIVEKIKMMERSPPCNIPGEYYLLRKFIIASVEGKERLCSKTDNSAPLKSSFRTDYSTQLKFYVALEEIYDCIEEAHRSLKHGARDRIVRSLQNRGVVNITRETVELFLSLCPLCRPHHKGARKSKERVSNASDDSDTPDTCFTFSRSYIDLIDFSYNPNGEYRFGLIYLDLQTNFCIARPVRCRCPSEIASHLLDIYTTFGPTLVLHGGLEESFVTAVINQMKQAWSELAIVYSTNRNYPEIQEVASNCKEEIKALIKTWLSKNDSHDWSSALRFVQLQRNSTVGCRSTKCPFECLFGKPSFDSFKTFPLRDLSLLREIDKEDELINLMNAQPKNYANLLISIDPNVCDFVQSNESNENDTSLHEASDHIIDTSDIKKELLSDSDGAISDIPDFNDSSNDASCSPPGFGKLEIVIKREEDL